MRYAEKECADCNVIMPANYMARASKIVVTGRSETTRTRKDGGVWTSAGSDSTVHTAGREIWLCPDCAGSRARLRFLMVLAVFAVVLIFGVLAALNDNRRVDRGGQIDGNNIVTDAPEPDSLYVKEESTGSASQTEQPQDTALDEDSSVPNPIPDPSGSSPAEDSTERYLAALLPDLEADIQKALDRGESVLWKEDKKRGYIVVSEPRSASDGKCRSFYVTLIDGEQQQQSAPQQRCYIEAGSVWR